MPSHNHACRIPTKLQKVITLVKGYGGRFMKMGGDGKWREMKHEDSHKKAVAALREVKW